MAFVLPAPIDFHRHHLSPRQASAQAVHWGRIIRDEGRMSARYTDGFLGLAGMLWCRGPSSRVRTPGSNRGACS
jgi:hypothetical protein